MALSCIVFDCDGIILESVDPKTAAFARICQEISPAHTNDFTAYVTLHGGVSRFEKFAWLIREAFQREITPKESRTMGEKFIRYCLESVMASSLVPGFVDVAKRWQGVVPMYVASGTPQYELEEVLHRKGLDTYFTAIYGTPPAKAALLLRAVRDAGAAPGDAVMVGDSKTDLDAALVVGTKFYGRGAYFAGSGQPWGRDLTKLNEFLERMAAGETA